MVWHGMAIPWYGIWYGMIYGMVWMVWYEWYGIWYGIILLWYGMIPPLV